MVVNWARLIGGIGPRVVWLVGRFAPPLSFGHFPRQRGKPEMQSSPRLRDMDWILFFVSASARVARPRARRLAKKGVAFLHRSVYRCRSRAVAAPSWRTRADVCRIDERSSSPWAGIPCERSLRLLASPSRSERDGWLVGSFASFSENDEVGLPAGSCCGSCLVPRLDLVAAFVCNGSAIFVPGRFWFV